MKRFFTFITLFVSLHLGYGQCQFLGLDSLDMVDLPWYGDIDYLPDYRSARGGLPGSNLRVGCSSTRYQLPVRLVVLRDDAGNPSSSISQTQAVDYLNLTNQFYSDAGTDISFYLYDFEFINPIYSIDFLAI